MKRLALSVFGLILCLTIMDLDCWAQEKKPPAKKPQPSRVTRKPPSPPKTTAPRTTRRYTRKPPRYQAPVFKLQADTNAMILYFSPADYVVAEKQTFYSDIMISNPQAKKFSDVYLVIEYDPELLEPLGISDVKLRSTAKAAPRAVVLEDEGKIVYQASLSQPLDITDDSLLLIKWKALKPTAHFTIKFSKYDNKFSLIRSNGEDVLGDQSVADDGVISASGLIKPLQETGEAIITAQEYEEKTVLGMAETGDIKLLLIPRDGQTVKVGQEFVVDIIFENPKGATLDIANLVIQFNPRILQVVDFDEGNWITRGVNIFDGDYHDKFPFDFHMKNLVDNQQGKITYKVGLTTFEPLPGRGSLASIKFQAIAPSAKTTIKFVPSRKGKEETFASLMGRDMLGERTNPADGLSNINLAVTR